MIDALRTTFFELLRLPPEPTPPAGAPGSIKVFRAGINLFRLSLARWALTQAATLFGILFSLTLLWQLESHLAHADTGTAPAPAAARAPERGTPTDTPSGPPAPAPASAPTQARRSRNQDQAEVIARRVAPYSGSLFPLIKAFEAVGVVVYLVQLVATFVALRLNYELRWYIVTDRSLRIRSGVWNLQEVTMSFANVQQVAVSQGPLQRLLGLADVRVQSAGGGGGERAHAHAAGARESMHTGVFQGVTNAPEIRDLILERLRRFREAGLGDPDDAIAASAHPPVPRIGAGTSTEALAAARELLAETRALRRAL